MKRDRADIENAYAGRSDSAGRPLSVPGSAPSVPGEDAGADIEGVPKLATVSAAVAYLCEKAACCRLAGHVDYAQRLMPSSRSALQTWVSEDCSTNDILTRHMRKHVKQWHLTYSNFFAGLVHEHISWPASLGCCNSADRVCMYTVPFEWCAAAAGLQLPHSIESVGGGRRAFLRS